MTAKDACNAAACGVRSSVPDANIVEVPLSDGGEGLVDCISQLIPCDIVHTAVHAPLMDIVDAKYAISADDDKTAYMEMAAASGLSLVPPDKRNPAITTTYGVGEMIADAIGRGCNSIILGIGGSATCDGGMGMVKAMEDRNCLNTTCRFVVASDVTNPLFGENGAAYVYAPQKGASASQIPALDKKLRAFALETEQRLHVSQELAFYPGAGAAGGLGYAMLAYLDAELKPGIDIMLDTAKFDRLISDADIIVTGEGKSDTQTMMGKVANGVMARCRKAGKPIWLFSGAIDDKDNVLAHNFDITQSINENDDRPLSILMRRDVAKKNLSTTIARTLDFYVL